MSDTAPIQTPELKPCPFCGSPASEDGNNLIGILISCSNAKCPVSPDVSGKNRAYAYPAWNTRADHAERLAELQAENKRLREALQLMVSDANRSDYHTRRVAFETARAALKEAHEDTEG